MCKTRIGFCLNWVFLSCSDLRHERNRWRIHFETRCCAVSDRPGVVREGVTSVVFRSIKNWDHQSHMPTWSAVKYYSFVATGDHMSTDVFLLHTSFILLWPISQDNKVSLVTPCRTFLRWIFPLFLKFMVNCHQYTQFITWLTIYVFQGLFSFLLTRNIQTTIERRIFHL